MNETNPICHFIIFHIFTHHFPMVSPFCSTVSQGMRHQQLFLRALPGLVVGDHGGGMEASPGLEMSRDFLRNGGNNIVQV